MVVTMIAMGMVQLSIHEVINVVAMGHGFVPARRAMLVRAARFWRALHRIGGIDGHDMLINMIPMHVMKMAIMEIIDMAIMADRRMPTIGTMLVGVIGMMLFGAGGHRVFTLVRRGSGFIDVQRHVRRRFQPNAERECRKANSRCVLPRVVF